jgi:hypothetical protein
MEGANMSDNHHPEEEEDLPAEEGLQLWIQMNPIP